MTQTALTWNSNIDFPLLDSSMNRKAPIPVFGLSASSLFPCCKQKECKLYMEQYLIMYK